MRNIFHRYPIHPKYSFPRDEQLMTHLMLAYLAIKFVKKTVIYGAANRPDSTPEAMLRMCFSLHWQDEQKKINGNQSQEISTVTQAKAAYSFKVGNCEGQASCAFGYLLTSLNVSNMEIFRLQQDHSFLVIGRDPQSDTANYSTWGKNAVVCDPWASRYFPATDLRYQLNDIFVEAKFPTIDASDPLTCHKLYSFHHSSKSMAISKAQARLTYRELNKIYNQHATSLALAERKITIPFPHSHFLRNHLIYHPPRYRVNDSKNTANIGFFKSKFKYSPPLEKNPWKVGRSWF